MKTRHLQATLLAALAASSAAVMAASVPVTGTMTYTQNFDTALGIASPAWADDSLIPGWYAQINNGATANGSVQEADGNTVLNGLLNCGTAGQPDRALGSKATGNTANISYAVSFQNTSASPIQWTGLHYTGECWLTNSTAAPGTAEVWTTYYQKSAAVVSNIISGGNSATPAAGAGFTAVGAGGNWTSPVLQPSAAAKDGNAAGNFTAVNFTPTAIVILQPGEFLTIKWTDSNLANADGFQAIDDVSVDFTQLDGSVVATLGPRTRDFAGTPANLADDTFGFSAVINGSGTVSTWTATGVNPPAGNANAGAYGTTAIWTGFPLTPKSVTITDAGNPGFTTSLTVPPLLVVGSNDLVVADTPILQDDAPIAGWTINETTRTLTQNNPGAQTDFVVNSEIIDLTTTGFLQFKADLNAITGTSSGFEAADRFALQLIINEGAPISVLGTTYDTNGDGYLTGFAAPAAPEPNVPGAELPDTNDTSTSRFYNFAYIVPDTANTLQIRIIGNSNSGSETFSLTGIKLVPPPPSILASLAGPVVFDNKGTPLATDDEFSAPVTITPVNLSGSPGWNSNSTPATGVYSPPAVTFGPFLLTSGPKNVGIVDQTNAFVSAQVTIPLPAGASVVVAAPTNITRQPNGPGLADDTVTFQTTITGTSTGPSWNATGTTVTPNTGIYGPGLVTFTIPAPLPASPASVIITDVSYATATQTISVPFPAIYTIGQTNFGALQPVISLPVSVPDNAWVNDAAARTLTMNNGTATGAGVKTVTSEVVDLSAVAGPVQFSANLHITDLTAGFEVEDTFNAYLIYDENTLAPVSLITARDVNASGTLEDDELCPAPAGGGNATQNFDYLLAPLAPIPDNVNTVQLVIAGVNNSTNETMIVSNVLFSLAPPTTDNDGDGISNADEAIMGTNPDDASSALRLTQNAGNPLQLDFPTVANRFYRVYVSDDATPATHLQSWNDAGFGTITGDGNPTNFTITVTPGQVRRYYRLAVKETDANWPATLP